MANGFFNTNSSNMVYTKAFSKTNQTIAASSTASYSWDVTVAGWTPLGIIGVKVANSSSGGVNSSNMNFYRWYVSGNTAYLYVKNLATSAAKVDFTITVIYRKNLSAPY